MTLETNTLTLAERIKAGEAMLNEGATFHAVLHFARLLGEQPAEPEINRHAARALVLSVENGSIAGDWSGEDRASFFRTLVLQRDCARQPPYLHEAIVTHASANSSAWISRIARSLSPTLQEIQSDNAVSKNFVILVLILRRALNGWIDQPRISTYHLEWLPRFTVDDMSLLYNSMFSTAPPDRTTRDIAEHLSANRGSTNGTVAGNIAGNTVGNTVGIDKRMPVFQLTLFYWLLGNRLQPDQKAWVTLVLQTLDDMKSPADSVAAAKSLLIRHLDSSAWQQGMLEAASSIDKHAQLRSLLQNCVNVRTALLAAQDSQDIGRSSRLFAHPAWHAYQAAKGLLDSRLAPFVTRKQRRLKVAVCVTGQLRGYKAAFATWQRGLLSSVDHTLFVHSWTKTGRSGAEPFRYVLPFSGAAFTAAYKEMANRVGFDEFQRRYPAFFSGLAQTGQVSTSDVADFYGTEHVVLDDERAAPFSAMTNQDKMHYKIQAGFDLAESCGSDHDLIVRIRPDKPVKLRAFDWSMLRDICRASNTIYADHATGLHYSVLMIGDQFAVGTPATMAIYSRAWRLYPPIAAAGLLKCSPNFEGHASLAQVCWLHGIDVKRIPMTFGKLQDAEPLNSRQILGYLETDAAGRMDEIDQTLIRAASADDHPAH